MSGQVPEAAIEAADAALRDHLDNFPGWKPRGEAEALLEAAYPHIRRAVIEELIGKYEAQLVEVERNLRFDDITNVQLWHTLNTLRAELEGDDRG